MTPGQPNFPKALRRLFQTRLWTKAVYLTALATASSQQVGDPSTTAFGESIAALPGRRGAYSPPIAMRYFVRRGHMEYRFDQQSTFLRAVDGRLEFQDLTWLFQCCPANRGIITMDLDEASYLYRVARSLCSAQVVEIGRYKGGSTFLLASAIDEASRVLSIDAHVAIQTPGGLAGSQLDDQLRHALRMSALDSKVEFVVADSRTYRMPPNSCDLIFVDGDHTYSGVRGDYDNWKNAIKPGGHLVFHDAVNARPYASYRESIGQLISEIEDRDGHRFIKRSEIGSLVHFVRSDHQ